MDQFWLLVEFTIGLLNLPIVVTMFTVLAFMTNLNGFPMLTFTSGTKDIFRLILYDATYFMVYCSHHFSETYSSFLSP
jgi:hypothetical protein